MQTQMLRILETADGGQQRSLSHTYSHVHTDTETYAHTIMIKFVKQKQPI